MSSIRPFFRASAAPIGSPATIIFTASSGADRARQALRATGARQQAEFHLGQTQSGVLGCNAEMAGKRDLKAAAQCGAMNCSNDRLRRVFHFGQHFMQTRRLRRLAEFGDVGAGNKSAAGTGQYDCLYFRIGDRALDALQDAAPDGGAQRIDGRTVDRDDADDVMTLELDHFVHEILPGSPFLPIPHCGI